MLLALARQSIFRISTCRSARVIANLRVNFSKRPPYHRHSPEQERISLFPGVDSRDRVLVEGDVGWGLGVRISRPFHRRFTRLHNAATLIKINYTLTRQFALLSLSFSLLHSLLIPHPCSFFLCVPLPLSHFPSSFFLASFFSLSPCRFFVPHFRPPPG